METKEITIETGRRRVVDVTGDVFDFCLERGDGLCSVFAPHATAGVGLMELGSGSEADLDEVLDRLLPPRRSLQAPTRLSRPRRRPHPPRVRLTLARVACHRRIANSRNLARVVLVDTNVDNPDRHLRLSFLAG